MEIKYRGLSGDAFFLEFKTHESEISVSQEYINVYIHPPKLRIYDEYIDIKDVFSLKIKDAHHSYLHIL